MQRPFRIEQRMAARRGGAAAAEEATAAPALSVIQGGGAMPALGGLAEAMQRIEGKIDRVLNLDTSAVTQIQDEIHQIASRIETTKHEIAALRHPKMTPDNFEVASEQLSAVVQQTETATNEIIGAAERIDDIAQELATQAKDAYQKEKLAEISELVLKLYEACNFQDLTGQRITKVVTVLTFIEERVDRMIAAWSKSEIEAMPVPEPVAKVDSGLELHGPSFGQDAGDVSQADIDAMFQ